MPPQPPLLPPDDATSTFPLVEIIELKWLLAGEGIYIHVEKLQKDAAYAQRALDQASASASPTLRAAALRLRRRLAPEGSRQAGGSPSA